MILRILCQHRKHLSKLFSRNVSTAQNENIIIAKSLMNHIDSLNESCTPNFFHLQQLKNEITLLHDEYTGKKISERKVLNLPTNFKPKNPFLAPQLTCFE